MFRFEDCLCDKNFNFFEINPHVRHIQLIYNQYFEHYVPKRKLYDFHFLYVVEGEMEIEVDEKIVVLKHGDFVLIPPKMMYKETIPNEKFCKYYIMCFDLIYTKEREKVNRKELYLKYCRKGIEEAPFIENLFPETDKNFLFLKSPIIVQSTNTIKIYEILNEMLGVYEKNIMQKKNVTMDFHLKGDLLKFFSILFENGGLEENTNSYEFVNKFIEYVLEHYSENIDINKIGKEIGYTPNYFRAIFKQETGVTPFNYLLQYRIKMAKELFSKGYSVCEVARKVGFENEFYFSKVFKKQVGVTPTMYKQKYTVT